jgi:hypothetical protein
MNPENRSRFIVGILLILIGGWFLVARFVPQLRDAFEIDFAWPLIVVFVGLGLLVMGLLLNAPGMSVPACIVAGIGGLLYWQNATGNWASWSYTWTLIPGFVGIGIILNGIFEGKFKRPFWEGSQLILISLFLFLIFASFLGGFNWLGGYWPILLIVWGLLLMVRPLLKPKP